MLNYEFPPLGGGGSFVSYNLAKKLAQFGHEIDVVTMGYKDLKKHEFVDGINIYRIPCIRRRKGVCHTYEMLSFIVLAVPVILKLVETKKYVLNHTHFIFPTGVLSLIVKKLTGLKYFVTAHGSDIPGHNPERFQLQHKLFLPLWKGGAKCREDCNPFRVSA
jgi:hypothetical protein